MEISTPRQLLRSPGLQATFRKLPPEPPPPPNSREVPPRTVQVGKLAGKLSYILSLPATNHYENNSFSFFCVNLRVRDLEILGKPGFFLEEL